MKIEELNLSTDICCTLKREKVDTVEELKSLFEVQVDLILGIADRQGLEELLGHKFSTLCEQCKQVEYEGPVIKGINVNGFGFQFPRETQFCEGCKDHLAQSFQQFLLTTIPKEEK